MIKKFGIPKEVKEDEGRVSLIPEHISQFTGIADIYVETGAGIGSGFSDKEFVLRSNNNDLNQNIKIFLLLKVI